jgi:hypothetical protein
MTYIRICVRTKLLMYAITDALLVVYYFLSVFEGFVITCLFYTVVRFVASWVSSCGNHTKI